MSDNIRNNYRQPWTGTQDAELRALTTAHNSVHEIAVAMGRTVAEVIGRQQQLGITPAASSWFDAELADHIDESFRRIFGDGRRSTSCAELVRDAEFSRLLNGARA